MLLPVKKDSQGWAQVGTLLVTIAGSLFGAAFWVITELHQLSDTATTAMNLMDHRVTKLEVEQTSETAAISRLSESLDRQNIIINQQGVAEADLSIAISKLQQVLEDMKSMGDGRR
jgi:hypothetical protein